MRNPLLFLVKWGAALAAIALAVLFVQKVLL
jgi:hypothetical protein